MAQNTKRSTYAVRRGRGQVSRKLQGQGRYRFIGRQGYKSNGRQPERRRAYTYYRRRRLHIAFCNVYARGRSAATATHRLPRAVRARTKARPDLSRPRRGRLLRRFIRYGESGKQGAAQMVTGGGAYIANGLYNADCITAMRTMPNECVDMVLTDPPYNINFVPQRTAERGAILNDNLSVADFDKLLGDYFTECYRLLKPDTFLVSFMSWATIPAFEKAIRAAGFQIKSMPIWVKNNFGIGYYTRPQYEPMYLAIKGNPAPPETAISDVLNYARVVKQVHTCEKPIPLLQRLITTFSHEGDVIFDGFAGGGYNRYCRPQIAA